MHEIPTKPLNYADSGKGGLPEAMRIAHIPFGVTRPLLDEFCRTPSTKHASERAYAKPLREAVRVKGEKKSEGY